MTDAAAEAPPATAGDVIRFVLRTTAERLFDTETAAMADEPDGLHQHRTHVRRLRSVLAGFRGFLDEAAATELRVRFDEWGSQLGIVRDIEVRAEVAEEAMRDLEIDDADLRTRLVDAEREAYRHAHARLRELNAQPRARARMDAVAAFAADPPFTSAAERKVGKLAKVGRAEAHRLDRAAKRSDGSIEALHEVRKAGRRLRYVAEALHECAPDAFGEGFEQLADAGEEVHDALGDHRDELIFIERLERARAQAGRAGERVDHYDALIERSAERAKHSLGSLDGALARVRKAAAAL